MKIHVLHVPGARDRELRVLSEAMDVELCVHPDPKRTGVMWNWARMLSCMVDSRDSGEWQLQLNDDVLPVAGWAAELPEALKNSPSPTLSLTWADSKSAPARAGIKPDGGGTPYVVGPYLLAGGALAYRDDVLEGMLQTASWAYAAGYRHDDITASYHVCDVLGLDTAVVTRALFTYQQTRSLMRHPQYRDASRTILDPGPAWDSVPAATAVGRGGRAASLDFERLFPRLGYPVYRAGRQLTL